MPGVAKSGLKVVSRGRRDPLTDAETVRLGRRLVRLLGVEHVSYPDDATPVVVQTWDAREPLSQEAAAAIEDVLGPFDVFVVRRDGPSIGMSVIARLAACECAEGARAGVSPRPRRGQPRPCSTQWGRLRR
jgi:hypothetical protein